MILLLELAVEAVPLFVEGLAVFVVLLHSVLLLLGCIHPEGLLEGERIDLLQDGLQGDQRLL